MSFDYSKWYEGISAQRSQQVSSLGVNFSGYLPLFLLTTATIMDVIGYSILNNKPVSVIKEMTELALKGSSGLKKLATGLIILALWNEITNAYNAWLKPETPPRKIPEASYFKVASAGYILALASCMGALANTIFSLPYYNIPLLGMMTGLVIIAGTSAFKIGAELINKILGDDSPPPTQISAPSTTSLEVNIGQ